MDNEEIEENWPEWINELVSHAEALHIKARVLRRHADELEAQAIAIATITGKGLIALSAAARKAAS